METTRTFVDNLGRDTKAIFSNFLKTYPEEGPHEYLEAIEQLCKEEKTTLMVNFEHVIIFSEHLANTIESEFYRMDPFLREAVKELIADLHPDYTRTERDQEREFYVAFHSLPANLRIREMNTNQIGRLVSIHGTVVRTSAVHPELLVGVFQCQDCQTIIPGIQQQFKYTEPARCPNPACESKNSFKLLLENSQFVDFQKVRAQESSEEIPSGSMPRSMDIILRHEMVERAKAGDKMLFCGTMIVIPDVAQLTGGRAQLSTRGPQRAQDGYSQEGLTGLKALGVRDLTYRLAFLATTVLPLNARAGQVNIRDEDANIDRVIAEYSKAEREKVIAMKNDQQLYQRLASSIAPSIFGHEEVKRGILLMLFGGVHKKTADHISLRGDINVCIVGDPSTAKSQFLKYVSDIVPRAVYTSGKASTAAGLTAAVVKDEDSGEFFIEAGALMLADNGICCIDEFDKMDQRDQVAIHEAMEQQTITLTKAGIQATLNARTSVLAAANPINGRYDRSKSLKSNITLTAPIMSRFDLFFVIIDECHEVSDYNIARHITNIHRFRDDAVTPHYTTAEIQRYIKFSRTLRPEFSDEAAKELVQQYKRLRQGDVSGPRTSYRVTVRQLESMIRLSEALARLHCEDVITPGWVREAARLIRTSILRVETEQLMLDDGAAPTPSISHRPGTVGTGETEGQPGQDALGISFEMYRAVALKLVSRLRAHEEMMSETDDVGLRKGELINWYLEQFEGELGGTEEAFREYQKVYLIIERLIKIDGVLLEVEPQEEEEPKPKQEQDAEQTQEKANPTLKNMLFVHPNFADPTY